MSQKKCNYAAGIYYIVDRYRGYSPQQNDASNNAARPRKQQSHDIAVPYHEQDCNTSLRQNHLYMCPQQLKKNNNKKSKKKSACPPTRLPHLVVPTGDTRWRRQRRRLYHRGHHHATKRLPITICYSTIAAKCSCSCSCPFALSFSFASRVSGSITDDGRSAVRANDVHGEGKDV